MLQVELQFVLTAKHCISRVIYIYLCIWRTHGKVKNVNSVETIINRIGYMFQESLWEILQSLVKDFGENSMKVFKFYH